MLLILTLVFAEEVEARRQLAHAMGARRRLLGAAKLVVAREVAFPAEQLPEVDVEVFADELAARGNHRVHHHAAPPGAPRRHQPRQPL